MIIDKIYDSRYQETWEIKYSQGQLSISIGHPETYQIIGLPMVVAELIDIEHKPTRTIFETKKHATIYLDNLLKSKGVKDGIRVFEK